METVPCAATANQGETWSTDPAQCASAKTVAIDGTVAEGGSSQAFYDQALAVWPGDPTAQTVYFRGIGIYRSTDGGGSWDFLASEGGVHWAMDRELVLAVLIALVCGAALTACGFWPPGVSDESGDALSELQAWRRLWLPFVPAAFMLAALFGWAIREPAQAERVPNTLLWCSLPFAAIFVRAAWRAARSMRAPGDAVAATVGLIRPRVVISPRLAATLDAAALAAALEHERAHARHRDPLRLWLAQIATDLLLPWPAAKCRLMCWKRSLELARDDEARFRGASGADLAAAIIASVRITPTAAHSGVTARLSADEAFLKRRVAHLLTPLAGPAAHRERTAYAWLIPIASGVYLAFLLGTLFGERGVRALFGLP